MLARDTQSGQPGELPRNHERQAVPRGRGEPSHPIVRNQQLVESESDTVPGGAHRQRHELGISAQRTVPVQRERGWDGQALGPEESYVLALVRFEGSGEQRRAAPEPGRNNFR